MIQDSFAIFLKFLASELTQNTWDQKSEADRNGMGTCPQTQAGLSYHYDADADDDAMLLITTITHIPLTIIIHIGSLDNIKHESESKVYSRIEMRNGRDLPR